MKEFRTLVKTKSALGMTPPQIKDLVMKNPDLVQEAIPDLEVQINRAILEVISSERSGAYKGFEKADKAKIKKPHEERQMFADLLERAMNVRHHVLGVGLIKLGDMTSDQLKQCANHTYIAQAKTLKARGDGMLRLADAMVADGVARVSDFEAKKLLPFVRGIAGGMD
jgi:hypothetical protein